MATDAQITDVQRLLGPDASDENGWSREAIADLIDSGKTNNEIALAWWEQRAASTADYVDISESGSSRALSKIHSNAVDFAAQYRKIIADEQVVVTARKSLNSIRMNRV